VGLYTVVATRHGPMVVNPHDQYVGTSLIQYGEFSPGETRLFTTLLEPGSRVLEVGANIGALTIPLARHLGPRGLLVAIEAQRLCHQMLAANCALNSLTTVHALHLALGDSNGTITVPRLDPTRDNNFGGVELGKTPTGDRVLLRTLDSMVQELSHPPFDFVKLDVEGMEEEVLRGGEMYFTSHHPYLYVENDRLDKSDSLIRTLHHYGYRCWWHTPPLYESDNFHGNPENVWGGNIVSANLFCVHPARRTPSLVIDLDLPVVPEPA
jgi:FkbM family methyltransferase